MVKFEVTMQRTEYREHVFEIEAESAIAAAEAAHNAANNYNFHDSPVHHAQNDVTDVIMIDE